MPTRYLLINPNASAHITARLAASARAVLTPAEELHAVHAAGGPAVVRDAATLAQADANTLALADAHAADADAVLLGISLDGAADTLRRRHPRQTVVGMTEAALCAAVLRADRVGLLTLGPQMAPLYHARVAQIGLAARVAGVQAPDVPAAFAPGSADVDREVLSTLADAGRRLQDAGAGAVVLAGAVLCGYAPALTARLGLPVFDGMACAVWQARALLALAP